MINKKISDDNNNNNNNNDNLRELPVATANPGDARVKVGSERQAASRLRRQTGCRRDRLYNNSYFARGDPPILALP